MFGGAPLISVESMYYLSSYLLLFLIAFVGATPLPKRIYEKMNARKVQISGVVEVIILAGLLILVTAYLVDGSFNPFLYFRF